MRRRNRFAGSVDALLFDFSAWCEQRPEGEHPWFSFVAWSDARREFAAVNGWPGGDVAEDEERAAVGRTVPYPPVDWSVI